MALQLFYHPFSSYCQKVLVALYENATPFEPRLLEGPDSPAMVELVQRWPIKRFPLLVDEGKTIIEATCIIEHLGLFHPGPPRVLVVGGQPHLARQSQRLAPLSQIPSKAGMVNPRARTRVRRHIHVRLVIVQPRRGIIPGQVGHR